jgi:hypothetical protein
LHGRAFVNQIIVVFNKSKVMPIVNCLEMSIGIEVLDKELGGEMSLLQSHLVVAFAIVLARPCFRNGRMKRLPLRQKIDEKPCPRPPHAYGAFFDGCG